MIGSTRMIFLLGSFVLSALAIGQYQFQIPNGFYVPCPPGQCLGLCAGVGHLNNDKVTAGCAGGEHPFHYNNNFGLDLQDYGAYFWNASVCVRDSDGDGQTNGDELGDPCCRWTTDNPTPVRPPGSVSHPGFATSKVKFKSCLLDGAPFVKLATEFVSQTAITMNLDFNNTCSCDTTWQLKFGNSSNFRYIDTLIQQGNNFTLSGLEPGFDYSFQIITSNLNGTFQTTFDIATNPMEDDALPPPSNISLVSATASSIFLTWPTVAGSINYQLDVAAGSGSNATMFTTVYIGSTTNFQLTNLSSSTTYQFRVRSINADGVGDATSIVSFATTSGNGNSGNNTSGNTVTIQGYKVTMNPDALIRAGTAANVAFSIVDPTGVALAYGSLTEDKMRRMHVFFVSGDLDIVGRVAPEDFPANTPLLDYSVSFRFPKQGNYMVIVMFVHNSNHVTAQFNLTVAADISGGAKHVGNYSLDFTTMHVMMGNPLTGTDAYTSAYDISVEDMTEMASTVMVGSIYVTISGEKSLQSGDCSQIWFRFQNPREKDTVDMDAFLGGATQVLVFNDDMSDFQFVTGNSVENPTTSTVCDSPKVPPTNFGPYVNVPVTFSKGGTYWVMPFWVKDNDAEPLYYVARFTVTVADNSLTPLTSDPISAGDFDYHVSVLQDNMDIYWKITRNVITMGLTAKATGWVGIGFNPSDGGMSNADMIMGWIDSTGVKVNDYWSTDEVAPTLDQYMQSTNGTMGIQNIMEFNGSSVDGITTIKFRRLLDTGDSFDAVLSPGEMTIVYAYNPTTNQLVTHGPILRGKATVDLFSGDVGNIDSGASALEAMRTAHAVLMTLGWMVFVPMGIIIARFFHHYKWWFPVHIAVMTIAIAMVIVGFVIGIVMTSDNDFLQTDLVARSHSWLGLIVVILGVAQPILGYIADRMWDANREYVPFFPDKLHWYFGRYSAVGAYANVILGMIYLNVWYGWWILLGLLILIQIIGVHFLMQMKRRLQESHKIAAEKSSGNDSTEMTPNPSKGIYQTSSTSSLVN